MSIPQMSLAGFMAPTQTGLHPRGAEYVRIGMEQWRKEVDGSFIASGYVHEYANFRSP